MHNSLTMVSCFLQHDFAQLKEYLGLLQAMILESPNSYYQAPPSNINPL